MSLGAFADNKALITTAVRIPVTVNPTETLLFPAFYGRRQKKVAIELFNDDASGIITVQLQGSGIQAGPYRPLNWIDLEAIQPLDSRYANFNCSGFEWLRFVATCTGLSAAARVTAWRFDYE